MAKARPGWRAIPIDRHFRDLVRGFLRSQRDPVFLSILRDTVIDLTAWTQPMADAAQGALSRTTGTAFRDFLRRELTGRGGASPLSRMARYPFGLEVPEVREFVRNMGVHFAVTVNQTSVRHAENARQWFRNQLAQGLERGEAQTQLMARLNVIFRNPERTSLIAMTESSRAVHGGQLLAARRFTEPYLKEWYANSDACFRADSEVVKSNNGRLEKARIDSIRPGDVIVSGKGRCRRVSAVSRKHFSGSLICGPGFAATPEHLFWSQSGWRPIGQYASHAGLRVILDKFSGKSQNAPPALCQIRRLAAVFGCDARFVMPVFAVAKYNKVPFGDQEINDPSSVHRDLFAEWNASVKKQSGDDSFDIGPVVLADMQPFVRAQTRTKIGSAISISRYTRRVFSKLLSALMANARHSWFSHSVSVALHCLGMMCRGALARTELLPRFADTPPFADEGFVAHKASNRFTDDAFRASDERLGLTNSTAESRFAFDVTGMNSICLAALGASSFPRPINAMQGIHSTFETTIPPSSVHLGGIRPTAEMAHWESCAHSDILLLSVERFDGDVFDISVEEDHSFMLGCGLIAHNCPVCLALDGKTVGLDEPFAIDERGGPYAIVQSPPRHPRCRCALQLVPA